MTTTTINTREELRTKIHQLSTSAWTLAALAAAFESGIAAQLVEPRTIDEIASRVTGLPRERIERCLTLLAVEGFLVRSGDNGSERYTLSEGVRFFMPEPARPALEGEMRSTLMQTLAYVNGARAARANASTNASADAEKRGWNFVDRDLLIAQGAASGGFPPMFKMGIVPSLGDLASRLDKPGVRFLDIGVGVGKLAISMARAWPELNVVGLDCFDAPLALAREHVKEANLESRIELRRGLVQDLADSSAFDLAWLPVVFMPDEIVDVAMTRVRAALKPGGWVLCALLRNEAPAAAAANADLDRSIAVNGVLTEFWGGSPLASRDIIARLERAGFTSGRAVEGPPWAPLLVVAQVPG